VRLALSDKLIAGAYAADRSYMLQTVPRIISVEHRGGRTLVAVALLTVSAPPSYQSFLFVRRRGQFRIMYDTFLEAALASYGQQLEQEKINPLATKPAAGAVAAGVRLARRFREVYLR
jgi:hypothetical protein